MSVTPSAPELLASGNYPAAVDSYHSLLKEDPGSNSALTGLGLALALAGNPAEGRLHTGQAVSRQPANPETRFAHGRVLALGGDYRAAVDELDAAVTLQPNHTGAKAALVESLMRGGHALIATDPVTAEAMYDRARKLDSRNGGIAAAYLDLLARTNQKGKVKHYLEDCGAHFAHDPAFAGVLSRLPADYKPTASASAPVTAPRPAAGPLAAPTPTFNPATGPGVRPVMAPRKDKPEWQPIAYNVMLFLWIGLAVWDIASALIANLPGYTAFICIMGAARIAIALGLLARTEWVSVVGKAMCYLTVLGQIMPFWMGMMMRQWLVFGISVVTIAAAFFMLYLIGYEND